MNEMNIEEIEKDLEKLRKRGLVKRRWIKEKGDWAYNITDRGIKELKIDMRRRKDMQLFFAELLRNTVAEYAKSHNKEEVFKKCMELHRKVKRDFKFDLIKAWTEISEDEKREREMLSYIG